MTELPFTVRSSRRLIASIAIVIFIWAGYTALQTLSVTGQVNEEWSAALGFLPGILGVTVLTYAGVTREACYLVVNRISLKGFVVLTVVFIFSLSAILPVSIWHGWNWKAALILAPASGISQELFFRSSLLPALNNVFRNRHKKALIFHSVLFGLWHIGPLFIGAPIWAVVAVMLVPFLSGIGWGWQVMHDRTVIWAMIQHSLIWVICLQFVQPV